MLTGAGGRRGGLGGKCYNVDNIKHYNVDKCQCGSPRRLSQLPELLPCHHWRVCHHQAPYRERNGVLELPDGSRACELLEGGVHTKFGLQHTGNQHLVLVKEHLVLVKEVLQFCVLVLNAVSV